MYGKYKSLEELIKGYQNLEATFTKKCQKIKSLEESLEETQKDNDINSKANDLNTQDAGINTKENDLDIKTELNNISELKTNQVNASDIEQDANFILNQKDISNQKSVLNTQEKNLSNQDSVLNTQEKDVSKEKAIQKLLDVAEQVIDSQTINKNSTSNPLEAVEYIDGTSKTSFDTSSVVVGKAGSQEISTEQNTQNKQEISNMQTLPLPPSVEKEEFYAKYPLANCFFDLIEDKINFNPPSQITSREKVLLGIICDSPLLYQSLAKKQEFVDLLLENRQLTDKLSAKMIAKLQGNTVPQTIGQGSNYPLTPPNKPKTLEEANKLIKHYL
ncbi:MAG: hypothetical protein RR248_04065 [Clostridia bacterium]